jgi:hypothetical protein
MQERRADPAGRVADIAERAERSRQLSATIQFAVFAAIAAIGAGFIALKLFGLLSRPFALVQSLMLF